MSKSKGKPKLDPDAAARLDALLKARTPDKEGAAYKLGQSFKKALVEKEPPTLECPPGSSLLGPVDPQSGLPIPTIVNIPGFGEVEWKGMLPAADTKPLLDDIQRLTEELELARTELSEVRAETYDDKMGYWKNRALMAEARAKQLEEMN